jgi:putative exosortase-associated protein (TIGR04073 family)
MNYRLLLVSACVVAAMSSALAANAEQRVAATATTVVPAAQLGEPTTSPAEGIGRGFFNMCCCWLELPRNIVYDNVRVCPVAGVFTGAAKGAFYTVARGLVGTADVVTLGLTRNLMYDEKAFPEYIWDAPWY